MLLNTFVDLVQINCVWIVPIPGFGIKPLSFITLRDLTIQLPFLGLGTSFHSHFQSSRPSLIRTSLIRTPHSQNSYSNNIQYLQVFTWIERVNSLHRSLHMFKVYGRELNDQTGNIGLSHILVLLNLHRNYVTSLIRTNSLIGTDFFKIWTPLFGLARVYCTREPSNSIPIPKIRI